MAKINLKAYRHRVPIHNSLLLADRQQEMNQLFNITMLLGRKSNQVNDSTNNIVATLEQARQSEKEEDYDKFSRIEKKIENNLTYISISVDNTDTGSIVNYNGIMENCNFFDIEDELVTLNAWWWRWSKKTLEEILFYIFLNLQSSVTFFLFTDKRKTILLNF